MSDQTQRDNIIQNNYNADRYGAHFNYQDLYDKLVILKKEKKQEDQIFRTSKSLRRQKTKQEATENLFDRQQQFVQKDQSYQVKSPYLTKQSFDIKISHQRAKSSLKQSPFRASTITDNKQNTLFSYIRNKFQVQTQRMPQAQKLMKKTNDYQNIYLPTFDQKSVLTKMNTFNSSKRIKMQILQFRKKLYKENNILAFQSRTKSPRREIFQNISQKKSPLRDFNENKSIVLRQVSLKKKPKISENLGIKVRRKIYEDIQNCIFTYIPLIFQVSTTKKRLQALFSQKQIKIINFNEKRITTVRFQFSILFF